MKYTAPEMELIAVETADIVLASTLGPGQGPMDEF